MSRLDLSVKVTSPRIKKRPCLTGCRPSMGLPIETHARSSENRGGRHEQVKHHGAILSPRRKVEIAAANPIASVER